MWIADQVLGAMGDYRTRTGEWEYWEKEWLALSESVEVISVSLLLAREPAPMMDTGDPALTSLPPSRRRLSIRIIAHHRYASRNVSDKTR